MRQRNIHLRSPHCPIRQIAKSTIAVFFVALAAPVAAQNGIYQVANRPTFVQRVQEQMALKIIDDAIVEGVTQYRISAPGGSLSIVPDYDKGSIAPLGDEAMEELRRTLLPMAMPFVTPAADSIPFSVTISDTAIHIASDDGTAFYAHHTVRRIKKEGKGQWLIHLANGTQATLKPYTEGLLLLTLRGIGYQLRPTE